MSNWVINVSPTRYNFYGAVREFGKALPWDFPISQKIEEGDTVYFFLTATGVDGKNESDAKTEKEISKKMIEKILKRFVLKGVISEVKDEDDSDKKYWTDGKRGEDDKKKKHCAIIKITESFYDGEVLSGELEGFQWKPGSSYPISGEEAQEIEDKRKK